MDGFLRRLAFAVTKFLVRVLVFISRATRWLGLGNVSSRTNLARHELIQAYLRSFVWPDATGRWVPLPTVDPNDRGPVVPKQPVWVMWWQGFEEAPAIVHACLRSLERHADGRTVIRLDQSNVSQYTDLPASIREAWGAGLITTTHLSDLVRLNLLARHGGLWVDATVYISWGLDEIWKSGRLITNRQQASDQHENISAQRWSAYLLGGDGLRDVWSFAEHLLEQYWVSHTSLVHYHLIDYVLNATADRFPAAFAAEISGADVWEGSVHALWNALGTSVTANVDELLSARPFHKVSWRVSPELAAAFADRVEGSPPRDD